MDFIFSDSPQGLDTRKFGAVGVHEIGYSHAPGLFGSHVASGKRDILEMRNPLIRGIISDQEFAAPGQSILSEAISVKAHSQDLLVGRDSVFEEGSQDVGEMVLDLKDGKPGFLSVSSCVEIRM